MKTKLLAALSALAFALSVMSLASAGETAKAPEAAGDAKPLYAAKCPSPCDFSVKSHDKAEIAAILKEHAKAHHNGMVVSDADCEAMIKTVAPKK